MSFSTDSQVDELSLQIGVPLPSLEKWSFWGGTWYTKGMIGIGSTYNSNSQPSHASLGIGAGYLIQNWRLLFLADQDEEWSEDEGSFEIGVLYRFSME